LGALYEFDSSTNSLNLKFSFNSSGESPMAKLTKVGNLLYSSATSGDSGSSGTLFAYDDSTNQLSIDASFGCNGLANPLAALTAGNNDLLHGHLGRQQQRHHLRLQHRQPGPQFRAGPPDAARLRLSPHLEPPPPSGPQPAPELGMWVLCLTMLVS